MKIKTVSTTQKNSWISKAYLTNTSLSRAIKCQFTCFKFTFVTLFTIHKKCWNTGNIHSKHMLVALTVLSTAIKTVKNADALLNDYWETLIFSHKWLLSSYLITWVSEQNACFLKLLTDLSGSQAGPQAISYGSCHMLSCFIHGELDCFKQTMTSAHEKRFHFFLKNLTTAEKNYNYIFSNT